MKRNWKKLVLPSLLCCGFLFAACGGQPSGLVFEETASGTYSVRGAEGAETSTEVILPDSYKKADVTEIGTRAFYGWNGLAVLELPERLVGIGDMAFYACNSLPALTLPTTVTSIGYSAFWGCRALASVAIPEGVTALDESTFENCSALVEASLGGVRTIGLRAFYSCTALEKVVLPASVTEIGAFAFFECGALTAIEYGGTIDGWKAIEKGDSWDKDTGAYTVVCWDGTIPKGSV